MGEINRFDIDTLVKPFHYTIENERKIFFCSMYGQGIMQCLGLSEQNATEI